MLQDGDSLEELEISENDVITIVEQHVQARDLQVVLNNKTISTTVKDFVSVESLKEILIYRGELAWLPEEFELIDVESKKALTKDESSPMFLLDGSPDKIKVSKKSFLVEVGGFTFELLKEDKGEHVKKVLLDHFNGKPSDASLFVKGDGCRFRKILNEARVFDEMGENNAMICLFHGGMKKWLQVSAADDKLSVFVHELDDTVLKSEAQSSGSIGYSSQQGASSVACFYWSEVC